MNLAIYKIKIFLMLNIKKSLKIKIFLGLFFLSLFLFFNIDSVLASSNDVFGINTVDNQLVLEKSDPRQVVARIINIFLGLMGLIAVSLIIFAGFTWMTSEGNEEKISKAKGILKSATIGLFIIMSAWGIVTFIFRELADQDSPQLASPDNSTYFQNGLGAVGACTVESVYPEPGQKNVPRNSMIMVTFKEEVSPETVIPNTNICLEENFSFESMSCSEPVSFTFDTSDNKIFVLFPDNILGNENSDSSYVVYFSNNVLKLDGSQSIFNTCAPQYLLWNFIVSNKLDLTPPKILNIFPQDDDGRDSSEITSTLQFAQGSILVSGVPSYFESAKVVSVTNGGGTTINATASVNQNYNGLYTNFTVSISAAQKAQLSSGSTSLGAFDIVNNQIEFTNYFSFKIDEGFESGNSWSVVLKKMIPADKIKVGSYEYTFVNSPGSGYNIEVVGNAIDQAQKICVALNDHPNVEVDSCSSNNIILKSRVGGSVGNSIILQSYSSKISVVPFSGGIDRVERVIVNDKKDKPMNSGIQITFDEAINPLVVSGDSEEVKNYIRILNLSENDALISGKFVISSNYKTVEFISDFKCGANSCGEDIFCLPANSKIKVEIMAAGLFDCEASDANCLNKSPFSSCINNVCQNQESKRYPLSATPINGVVDTALNSLDGNGDGYSYGPASYYNKNQEDPMTGDNYSWSFWINDKIDSTPPKILQFSPETPASLFGPIEIVFDKLLSADTLRTGQSISDASGQTVVHNRINLISGQLVGYWIDFAGQDVNPIDGDYDRTQVFINHAKFFEGAGYRAQAGSGVRDIYQNCFKPSASIDCVADPLNPSCCDGNPSPGSSCN